MPGADLKLGRRLSRELDEKVRTRAGSRKEGLATGQMMNLGNWKPDQEFCQQPYQTGNWAGIGSWRLGQKTGNPNWIRLWLGSDSRQGWGLESGANAEALIEEGWNCGCADKGYDQWRCRAVELKN